MKGKYIFLAAMLVVSGVVVGLIGVVAKYAVLKPLGLERPESAVALPFVLLRDEGLRYVISDLKQGEVAEEMPTVLDPAPTETESLKTAPTESTEAALPEKDIMEKVLFIGDSRTCGLRDHARMDGADYFCDVGMSVFNVGSKRLSDGEFQNQTLAGLLAGQEYTGVFVSLGLNEAGYPINSLIRAYQELVTTIVQTQPQAVIILQGVMTVSRGWAQQAPYASPENLNLINSRIRDIADEYRIFYIDANERFADPEGYLPDNMTADGCHFYAKYTHLWSDWLCEEVERLNI